MFDSLRFHVCFYIKSRFNAMFLSNCSRNRQVRDIIYTQQSGLTSLHCVCMGEHQMDWIGNGLHPYCFGTEPQKSVSGAGYVDRTPCYSIHPSEESSQPTSSPSLSSQRSWFCHCWSFNIATENDHV